MKLKSGYKITEVGVLPQDWEVGKLGERATFKTGPFGSALHKSDYTENGIPWINPIHIVDGKLVPSSKVTITREAANLLRDFKLRTNDIVIARRGDMGRCAVVQEHEAGWICGSGSMIIRCNSQVVPDFAQRVIASPRVISELENASVGSTMNNLNQAVLAGLDMPYPPPHEQRAIAEALSDVDALLDGLDRLIAKKRDLKQATMQQLLTGQTRLPGFHGEWEVKTLGDLGSTYGGLTGKTKRDFGEGSGQYVTFLNVVSNVVLDTTILGQVRVSPVEAQNHVMQGDLLFNGSSETPEEVAMCAVLTEDIPNLFLNSFCFGFRFNNEADADGLFMAYFFRSKEGRELMKSLAQGSTRYNLSKSAFLKSSIRLPKLPEQTAIAAVLSDMDAELHVLEQRREKTRALKQAMMQELLTGKTRLVAAGGSDD